MNPALEPLRIAKEFALPDPSDECVEIDATFAGMSGGRVWRVKTDRGATFALKQYSPSQSIDRVHQIHQWINSIACLDHSLVGRRLAIRDGRSTVYCASGTAWEFSSWIRGYPLEADASAEAVRLGTNAISLFHAASRFAGQKRGSAPSLSERFELLNPAREIPGPRTISEASKGYADDRFTRAMLGAAGLVGRHWPGVSRSLRRELSMHRQETTMQLVLRDVHREHLLFEQSGHMETKRTNQDDPFDQKPIRETARLTSDGTRSLQQPHRDHRIAGMIDFDAMRFDLRELDYARWIGSFCGATRPFDDLLERVLAPQRTGPEWADGGHEETFPPSNTPESHRVSSEQRALISLLYRCGVWIGLANWISWVTEKRRFPAGVHAVSQRVELLCGQASLLEH